MCISCAFDAHDRVGFLNSLAGFMQVLRPNASLTYWAHLSAITRPPCSCWYWLQDALVGCSDRVAPARASEKICGCESSPPRADRDTMQICRLATPLFALLAFQGFATSSRDRNRVNFPHTRAGTLPLATAGSRLTLDTCSDVPTTRQPARRSAGRNALLLLRCAYRFLTLSLMVNAPPCPPISVQSHTGKTTREVMSERPDHRDGDALVHELHQGATVGKSVITYH